MKTSYSIKALKEAADKILKSLKLKEAKLRSEIKDDLSANKVSLENQKENNKIELEEYSAKTLELKKELIQQYKDKSDELEDKMKKIRQNEIEWGYTYNTAVGLYVRKSVVPVQAILCGMLLGAAILSLIFLIFVCSA